MKSLQVAPKDKVIQISIVIYRYKSDRVECDEENISETARTFGQRFKKHLKVTCSIYDYSNNTGHTTTVDSFSIVEREDQNLSITIKESIYIKVTGPSLNNNTGKYHLPHI